MAHLRDDKRILGGSEFQNTRGKAGDWQCVADTGMPSPSDFFEVGQEKALTSLSYEVKARSVVVLLRTAGARSAESLLSRF
jgi:hypothetical protein